MSHDKPRKASTLAKLLPSRYKITYLLFLPPSPSETLRERVLRVFSFGDAKGERGSLNRYSSSGKGVILKLEEIFECVNA
jgi:hypothetical protein